MKEEQRWKTEMTLEQEKVKELRILNQNLQTFIDLYKQYHEGDSLVEPDFLDYDQIEAIFNKGVKKDEND